MRLLCVLFLAALTAHADVTLRYKIDATADAMKLPPGVDESPVIQMKGAKGVTDVGRLKAIIDFTKREVTLLDHERKSFATFPIEQFGAKLAAASGAPTNTPDPDLPKMDKASRKTGRTATILGVQAEETEATMRMDLGQASMSLVFHAWTPTPAEVLRVPAIRELTALGLWYDHFLKLGDELELPGVDGVLLRMEMEVRSSGQAIPGVDPSKPVFSCRIEATELSTGALDDALFRVPEGFTAQKGEELLKHRMGQSTTAVSVDVGAPKDSVKAYVPHLDPIEAEHRQHPEANAGGSVQVLVTIDADGKVIEAEPIAGPEALRKFAIEDVMRYRYRPVLRDGHPVVAMTDAVAFYGDQSASPHDMSDRMAAVQRMASLREQFPRTPQQVLVDLENDAGGPERRLFHAIDLAKAALDAGLLPTAEAYANLALSDKADSNDAWNRGNRVHYGNIVLGRVALRRDDVTAAGQHLIAAGKTEGSPQLNSFGPDMSLARELLDKGETAVVLQYLDECRAFWSMGAARLDAWTQDIRAGRKPKM
jgi:hypothetical protein